MAVEQESRYVCLNGNLTRERCWHRANTSQFKSIVVLVHGYGTHSQYFDSLATSLAQEGFLVYSHDLYGHGYSNKDIRKLRKFDVFVEEVLELIENIKTQFPDLPIQGIGYSMGALILHKLVKRIPKLLARMIWISPALLPKGMKLTPLKVKIMKSLFKKLPNFVLPGAKMSPSMLTRDKKTIQEMHQDSFRMTKGLYSKLTALMLQEMISLSPSDIVCPLKVFVGARDKIADPKRSLSFVNDCCASGKSVLCHIFKEGHHQLHSEIAAIRSSLCSQTGSWCQECC